MDEALVRIYGNVYTLMISVSCRGVGFTVRANVQPSLVVPMASATCPEGIRSACVGVARGGAGNVPTVYGKPLWHVRNWHNMQRKRNVRPVPHEHFLQYPCRDVLYMDITRISTVLQL